MLENVLVWDSKDDYYNTFFEQYNKQFEIVIRKHKNNFLLYIENCEDGELILDEEYVSYDELLQAIQSNLPSQYINGNIPNDIHLDYVETEFNEK